MEEVENNWPLIFEQCTGDNPEEVNKANSLIFSTIKSNPPKILKIALDIFQNKSFSSKILQLCGMIISRCLNYSEKNTLEAIRLIWKSDSFSETQKLIKSTATSAIADSNDVIKRFFSQIYAQIIAIEIWEEGFQNLANSIQNPEYRPILSTSFFTIFLELLNLHNYQEIIYRFPSQAERIFMSAIESLSVPFEGPYVDKEWINFRLAGINVINSCIQQIPSIFQKSEKLFELVKLIMTALPIQLPIPNSTLFFQLHQLMENLSFQFMSDFCSNPEIAQSFFNMFYQYTKNSLLVQDPSFLHAPLYMLIEIAQREEEIEQKNKEKSLYNDNKNNSTQKQVYKPEFSFPYSRTLSSQNQNELLYLLFSIMTHLSDSNIEIFDSNNLDPSMEAQSVFSCFFYNAPNEILDFLEKIWKTKINSPNWPERHAIIMLLDSVLSKSCSYEFSDEVLTFIMPIWTINNNTNQNKNDNNKENIPKNVKELQQNQEVFPYQILFVAAQCQNPRIMESALYVICHCISSFPQLINKNNIEKSQEAIKPILQLINISSDVPPIIFRRYIFLINAIIKAFPSDEPNESIIPTYFSMFEEILNSIWTFLFTKAAYLKCEPDFELLNKIIQVKENLILNIPLSMNGSKDTIFQIINQYSLKLSESLQNMNSKNDAIQYINGSLSLSIISTSLFHLYKYKTDKNQSVLPEQMVDNLFNLFMTVRNEMLNHEVLECFRFLIKLEDSFINSNKVQLLISFLQKCLASPEDINVFIPDSLNSALITISVLFDPKLTLYQYSMENIEVLYQTLHAIFNTAANSNSNNLRSVGGNVLKALSSIVCANIEYAKLHKYEDMSIIINRLLTFKNLLFQVQNLLDIDVSNKDEIINIETLACSIAASYIAITPFLIGRNSLQEMYPDQNTFKREEKEYLKEATDWIDKYINKNNFPITENLAHIIKYLIKILYDNQSVHNCIIICRPKIIKALSSIQALYKSINPKFSKEIEELIKQIKS